LCHLAGEIAHLFNISEGFLIVLNVCFGFHELDVFRYQFQTARFRVCLSITKVALSIIASVGSDDDVLGVRSQGTDR
jgi:hypothetical protein